MIAKLSGHLLKTARKVVMIEVDVGLESLRLYRLILMAL